MGAAIEKPAQYTRTSIPYFLPTVDMASVKVLPATTSAITLLTLALLQGVRETLITFQPRLASLKHVSQPMPELPPTTTAVDLYFFSIQLCCGNSFKLYAV